MKYLWENIKRLRFQVAPHWGAWIEIPFGLMTTADFSASHPTGVRGLKYAIAGSDVVFQGSHPTGVRGLKWHGCNTRRTRKSSRTPLGCVD